MTDKPGDNDPPEEAVQDYLDMLLSATEKPEAQVDLFEVKPEQSLNEQAELKQSHQLETNQSSKRANLTMVGGRSFRSSLSSENAPLEDPAKHSPAAEIKPAPKPDNVKPFAEPVKPLTLKMPLPEVKPVEPEPVTLEPEVKEQPVAPPVETPVIPEQPAPVVEEQPVEVSEPVVEVSESEIAEPQIEEQVELQKEFKPSEWINGRPEWAQETFECLLFSVGGLKLAVPLVELGTIYPKGEELTPLFGQIEWFLGLLPIKDGNIRTVNTAKLVMPDRYDDSMIEQYEYVITINGVDWGLAVNDVSEAISLSPDDVKWRTERSKRPWLAGTVVEHMCALVDVSQLALMFTELDNNR